MPGPAFGLPPGDWQQQTRSEHQGCPGVQQAPRQPEGGRRLLSLGLCRGLEEEPSGTAEVLAQLFPVPPSGEAALRKRRLVGEAG